MTDPLAEHDVELVRAANPSPLTLSGTNTWLVGRDPCWVVDPGPDLAEHVAAVLEAAAPRGGIGGIAVTHDHADHVGAVPGLVAGAGGDVAVHAARLPGAVVTVDGDAVGPLRAIAVPGHAPDLLCFALGHAVCFTGDAVLGEGSVFIAPDPGALAGYLAGLERLREHGFAVLAPGHGPVVLDADVPDGLRLPATVTLVAHLDKLAEEGRLPEGVEGRPAWFAQIGRHAH
jgi:glyoxylase-like metal-dependent hydrolase (beta-lactamase superfamily II)